MDSRLGMPPFNNTRIRPLTHPPSMYDSTTNVDVLVFFISTTNLIKNSLDSSSIFNTLIRGPQFNVEIFRFFELLCQSIHTGHDTGEAFLDRYFQPHTNHLTFTRDWWKKKELVIGINVPITYFWCFFLSFAARGVLDSSRSSCLDPC